MDPNHVYPPDFWLPNLEKSTKPPLLVAVQNENVELVHILLEVGADVNCRGPFEGDEHSTALIAAVERTTFTWLKCCQKKLAQMPTFREQLILYEPPLEIAVMSGNHMVVQRHWKQLQMLMPRVLMLTKPVTRLGQLHFEEWQQGAVVHFCKFC
jgi:Ankyrin repeat